MVAKTLYNFIQSPPMGASLAREERDSVEILNITPKYYPPHTLISRQGDDDSRIFIVNSGWACAYRDLSSGERAIIDTPLMGDIVGTRAAEGPNLNSLASITELSLFEISRQTLNEVLDYRPGMAIFFARITMRQHSILTEHLTNVGRRNALVRTAHFLLELGERLAAFGEGSTRGYDCPLTQQELADVLGLTAIHVNRTLRELREHKLISFRSGFVEFLNRPKLVKLSGFDGEYLRLNETIDRKSDIRSRTFLI
jgi:CRP-like cAMP-binding protein